MPLPIVSAPELKAYSLVSCAWAAIANAQLIAMPVAAGSAFRSMLSSQVIFQILVQYLPALGRLHNTPGCVNTMVS
jgi:hypothetical protein